jgi:transposase-like protein
MEPLFSEELKERQRYWLEHLRAARARGLKLAEYAREAQLESDALYRWRALFKRQGISIEASAETAPVPVSFAAVRVVPAALSGCAGVTVYVGAQIHVRCASWPEPRWLAELSQCLRESR